MDTSGNIMSDMTNTLLYFYNSPTFSVIKFIIGIYVVVIVVDLILMLYQRGVSGDFRDTRLGMNVPKEFLRKRPRQKLAQRFQKLREEIEAGDEARVKVALITADDIIVNLIRRMYAGAPFAKKEVPDNEMMEAIPDGQIENLADIKNSHLLRNRIIHDESFHPTKEEALETLVPYEEFLRYHGVLD